MAQPSFLERIRQRPQEDREDYTPDEAHMPPSRTRNPFMAAADDLAAQWEDMRQERDTLRDETEQLRGHNVYLAERVDSLSRELATRIEFFEVELDRVTQRADRAVNDATAIRAKLTVIAQAIRMVLDEEQAVAKREPRQEPTRESSIAAPLPRNLSTVQRPAPVRDFAQTPPEGHEVSEADAEDARDLINRLVPIALKR